MMNLEYHQGSYCRYTAAFCREGYRTGCEDCLKSGLYTKIAFPRGGIRIVDQQKQPVAAGVPA
jgi:hypothetical protein